MNEKGNKSIAPPNQNLQIFINPMSNHNISFVKASETKPDVMNVDTDDENRSEHEQSPMDDDE